MMRVSCIVLGALAMCVNSCAADNFTDNYRQQAGYEYKTRENRLLSFNTGAEDNINIELDFSVPFISIPVKSEMGHGALANLNVGAIALAGMMAFGAAFVVPATYHLFNTKATFGQNGFWPGEKVGHHSTSNKFGNRYRSKSNIMQY